MYSQTKYYLLGAILCAVGLTAGICKLVMSGFDEPITEGVILALLIVVDVFFFYRALVPRVLIKITPESIWTSKSGAFAWSEIDRLAVEERSGYKGANVLSLVIYINQLQSRHAHSTEVVYDMQSLNVRHEEITILLDEYLRAK